MGPGIAAGEGPRGRMGDDRRGSPEVRQVRQAEYERQERFYLLVGIAGVLLALIAWLLRREALGPVGQIPYLAGAVVVAAWSASGVSSSRRAAREERAVEAAREAAKQAEAEAREASRRAAQAVMARRTTSHAGMTIEVRRAGGGRPPAQAAADEQGDPS